MVPWFHGSVVLWFRGSVVPWFRGSVVPWFHGSEVTLRVAHSIGQILYASINILEIFNKQKINIKQKLQFSIKHC